MHQRRAALERCEQLLGDHAVVVGDVEVCQRRALRQRARDAVEGFTASVVAQHKMREVRALATRVGNRYQPILIKVGVVDAEPFQLPARGDERRQRESTVPAQPVVSDIQLLQSCTLQHRQLQLVTHSVFTKQTAKPDTPQGTALTQPIDEGLSTLVLSVGPPLMTHVQDSQVTETDQGLPQGTFAGHSELVPAHVQLCERRTLSDRTCKFSSFILDPILFHI
mmetsp:Transcript_20478/g.48865  ORF Transcript_20478/g.48865 Transcript_20478/m.48865 type:complete len:223 (+) Transcript_20478:387-1055(+)